MHPHQVKQPAGWFTLPDPDNLDKEEEEEPMDVQLKSNKFQVYDPVIPSFDVRYISYDVSLVGLENLYTFSTRLESTSQVLAYGHDLFLVRISPDNKFDMLDEEFNYSLLFLVIGALIAANYIFRKYLNTMNAKKSFLIH